PISLRVAPVTVSQSRISPPAEANQRLSGAKAMTSTESDESQGLVARCLPVARSAIQTTVLLPARSFPSGETARVVASHRNGLATLPLVMSQSRRPLRGSGDDLPKSGPSSGMTPVTTSRLLSGVQVGEPKAMVFSSGPSGSLAISLPLAGSSRRTLPSKLLQARALPLGEKATGWVSRPATNPRQADTTTSRSRRCSSLPVCRSHRRNVRVAFLAAVFESHRPTW